MNQSEYFNHMRLGNFVQAHWDELKAGKEVVLPVRFDDRKKEIKERITTVLRDRKEKWGHETLSPHEVKIKIKPGADIPRLDSRGFPIRYDSEQFSEYALRSIFQRALSASIANQHPPGINTSTGLYPVRLRSGDRLRKLSDGTLLEDALFQMAKWMKAVFAITGEYKEVHPEDGLSPSLHLLQKELNSITGHFPPELIDAVFFQKEFRMETLYDEREGKKIRFSDFHLKPEDILACIARKMEGGNEETAVIFYCVEGTPEVSELGTQVHLAAVADNAHGYYRSQDFFAVSEGGKVAIGTKLPEGWTGGKYIFFGDQFRDLDIPDSNVQCEVLRMEKI